MSDAVRYIIRSQLVLYAGLLVCIALLPAGLHTNDGISYYGIFERTLIPYTLALGGAAYFAWLAADKLTRPELRYVRFSLFLYTLLVVGIMLTPYSLGRWFDYLHTTFGSALFSLQLLLSFWLVWRLRTWWAWALAVVELVAGIFSAAYLSPKTGLLLQSQLLFQLAFGALLLLSLQKNRLTDGG